VRADEKLTAFLELESAVRIAEQAHSGEKRIPPKSWTSRQPETSERFEHKI
jgi:hypothetical protein